MLNEDNHFKKVCKKLGMNTNTYCCYNFFSNGDVSRYATKHLTTKSSKADVSYSISVLVNAKQHYSLNKIVISCDYITSQRQVKIIQEGIKNKNKFAKKFIKELNKGENKWHTIH